MDDAQRATDVRELEDLKLRASQMSLPDAAFEALFWKPWGPRPEPLGLLRELFPRADPKVIQTHLNDAAELRQAARLQGNESWGEMQARLTRDFPSFGESSRRRAHSLCAFEDR